MVNNMTRNKKKYCCRIKKKNKRQSNPHAILAFLIITQNKKQIYLKWNASNAVFYTWQYYNYTLLFWDRRKKNIQKYGRNGCEISLKYNV